MTIELIHVSDIHLGSGEGHGRLNPETGLNVRFEDFERAFTASVDYALNLPADVFLFSGDAYKSASPEPIYQRAFARQLKRLSKAGIPTILLVGNHDQIWKSTASHSMSVFQTLEIPNLTVLDHPRLVTIETPGGPLQIVGLPYVTKHLMMTYAQYAKMSDRETDDALTSLVSDVMRASYEELNPDIACVVTAHCMVDRARAGAEQELMIGYSFTLPMELFIDRRIDYVALGHVHRHQILRDADPLIAYCGSIERVDFSEEKEDKGFLHVSLERKKASCVFHSIEPRPFVTVSADLTAVEQASEHLCALVKKHCAPGCVLRVKYKIQQNRFSEVDESEVRNAAPDALSVRFQPELIVEERPPRLPDINDRSAQDPLRALEQYMEQTQTDNREALLAKAKALAKNLDD